MVIMAANEKTEQTEQTTLANNSGAGANSPVLDIVAKKFSWGAFFLTWIWGCFNGSYITLVMLPALILTFIPIIGGFILLGLAIWFGMDGNKWAWQNKRWESVEEFHKVQKYWAIAGLGVTIFTILLSVVTRH